MPRGRKMTTSSALINTSRKPMRYKGKFNIMRVFLFFIFLSKRHLLLLCLYILIEYIIVLDIYYDCIYYYCTSRKPVRCTEKLLKIKSKLILIPFTFFFFFSSKCYKQDR